MTPARLPRRIRVLDYTIRVQQLGEREFDKEWGDDTDAIWLHDEDLKGGVIVIRRRLPAIQKRWLLLHELIHAFNDLLHAETVT